MSCVHPWHLTEAWYTVIRVLLTANVKYKHSVLCAAGAYFMDLAFCYYGEQGLRLLRRSHTLTRGDTLAVGSWYSKSSEQTPLLATRPLTYFLYYAMSQRSSLDIFSCVIFFFIFNFSFIWTRSLGYDGYTQGAFGLHYKDRKGLLLMRTLEARMDLCRGTWRN